MIQVLNIRQDLDEPLEAAKTRVFKKLHITEKDVTFIHLAKKSIDARDKKDIFFLCHFFVKTTFDEKRFSSLPNVQFIEDDFLTKMLPSGHLHIPRPVVVGAGPAGLFAAYALAKMGTKPILIERGQSIEKREEALTRFYQTGELNPESNIQYGEGGAGTYSDGKLTTGTGNEIIPVLINEFVAHGAPEEIKYNNKPHLGTDNLKDIVKNIREHILALGGEVFFETKLVDFHLKDQTLKGVVVDHHGEQRVIPCQDVILALGHCARDTFEMLLKRQLTIEQKPFSMGVRIEHLQSKINEAQYGPSAHHPALRSADYKLAVHLPNGRGVYTFCMCPGGEVVAAASDVGGVVTNGMSYFSRSGKFANSGLLVNVETSDFPSTHPLAGFDLQRTYEQKTYQLSKGYGPVVQTVGDFMANRPTTRLVRESTCAMAVTPGEVHACLPPFVTSSLKEALPMLGRKLKGFDDPDTLLYAIESRSSCPIRLTRELDFQAIGFQGIYPCGEGSGYAGGITTSAVDGIRAARALMAKYL